MPAAAPKRPKSASAPSAPKKPTSKSKTGNSACSQAASNWQLAIRGKATIEPDTYKTLAKCRGMLRTSKAADGRAAAGYNLSDQGAAAIKGRLQSRFDRDLVSDKSRAAKVKELLAGRAAKQAAPVAKPAAAPAPAPALPPRTLDTMSEAVALSSPNGRMSKRSREAANQRLGVALFGPNGMPAPQVKQPSEVVRLRREAGVLRDLASRGMKPRAYAKEAKRLEEEAMKLESVNPAPAAAAATKSAWQAQDDRLRRLGAGTDVEVKRKRDWRQSQVASARNSLVHSREDRASLQQSRDAINYATRDRELPWMVDGVPITGDPNHRPQIKAPTARYTAARKEKAGQLVKERSERPISETDRKKAMLIAKRVTKAPSRKAAKVAAPVAAKPAAAAKTRGPAKPKLEVSGADRERVLKAIMDRAAATERGGKMSPPAPAKFSRNGELAPGRGTSERSAKAAQLRRYRQILPSVDGSATQPRLIQTGPTKTQHLVATVRSSNKYGLMRQRATANKERISENFGFQNITSSGDKRWENRDFRGRTLSDESRGKSAVKSRIDDLREKRADRPTDPTEARRSSPFGLRQIQERAASKAANAAYDVKPVAAAAPVPKAKPAPVQASTRKPMSRPLGQPERGSSERSSRVAPVMEARALNTLQREANRNAIPLLFKKQVPKGYTAEVFHNAEGALTPKLVKRVTGSTGIEKEKENKKNVYRVVSLSETHFGTLAGTGRDEKHATRMAKILDYMGRRAQRTTGGSDPMDAVTKNLVAGKRYRDLFAVSKRVDRRLVNTR